MKTKEEIENKLKNIELDYKKRKYTLIQYKYYKETLNWVLNNEKI